MTQCHPGRHLKFECLHAANAANEPGNCKTCNYLKHQKVTSFNKDVELLELSVVLFPGHTFTVELVL